MPFRNPRIDVDLEPALGVALRGRHAPQPSLEMLEPLRLVRNADLGVDHQGKVEPEQLAKDTREGGVREILQRQERVQQPTDLDVGLLIVLNMSIGCLLPGAPVIDRQFRPTICDVIAEERIHCPLQLQKHLFIRQPPNGHAGAIEGLFNALQNGFELRNEVFVFATGPLDALRGRGTPAAGHVA